MIALVDIVNGIEKLIAVQAEKYKPNFLLPPLTAADIRQTMAEADATVRARQLLNLMIPTP